MRKKCEKTEGESPGPIAEVTDAELLAAFVQTKSKQALEQLIAQTTLLLFCKKASGLDPTRSLKAWFHKTARYAVLEAKRNLSLQRHHEGAFAKFQVKETGTMSDDHHLQMHLHEALGRLPRSLREAVFLRHLVGLSEADAARELGCSVGTASMRVSRGLERMRRLMAKQGFALTPPLCAGLFGEAQCVELPVNLATKIQAVCTGQTKPCPRSSR